LNTCRQNSSYLGEERSLSVNLKVQLEVGR
jgi:hypothetical protein